MSFLLIDGGELRTPLPGGVQSILIAGGRIARVGEVDRTGFDLLGLEYERIDASGCQVWPGLIDVHEHLIGGSGESGWGSQTPELSLSEIVSAGVTTVVGCLGTDTVTKTMPALLARAKSLKACGLTAWIWTGGYDVPPITLTGSVQSDMILIEEVIGAGEIAIADHRSTAPVLAELARCVKGAHVGGILTGKCGVTHFHVGDEDRRMADVRALMNDWGVQPEWIYPTHVERSPRLLGEAAELSSRGVGVDMDVVEGDLRDQLRHFLDAGGELSRITASSDAAISSPGTLLDQIRRAMLDGQFPADAVLPMVTATPAEILRLSNKGRIRAGCDADLLILAERDLELRDVVARGKILLRNGSVVAREQFLAESNRNIVIRGERV